MSDFVAQVRAALEAIPHDSDCSHRIPLASEAIQALGPQISALPESKAFGWGPNVPLYNACACSRPQRIAQRVAAAIESAILTRSEKFSPFAQLAEKAALAALAASPQERGTNG